MLRRGVRVVLHVLLRAVYALQGPPPHFCCHKLLEPNRPFTLKLYSEVRDAEVRYFYWFQSLCWL